VTSPQGNRRGIQQLRLTEKPISFRETTMNMTDTYVPDPVKCAEVEQTVDYHTGFGNGFETEALPGALPLGRNSPQRCP
jgi:homogentisate 1,2-dioxygenase